VTHNSSRKQFFAKLFGVAAVAAILPKALFRFARPQENAAANAGSARDASAMPFAVRPDPRAVARREDPV
jgi:hypothetical protein